jgi:hypothetical protein
VWWSWVVGGLTLWLLLGAVLALLIGRSIRLADRRSPGAVALTTEDRGIVAAPQSVGVPPRRRAIPLPPVGIALAATAVALETSGLVLRLNGSTGPTAQLLSMDAPFALPRLFVALLFATAAVAAVAAAARVPSRRSWWLAVALVAGGIASVKAGGTMHAEALGALDAALGARATMLASGLAAAAVVVGLWSLTRNERRDRRRVLGALAFYAFAAVGLSAVSGAVPDSLSVTATYLEESAEALAGVAFLMAVLLGAVPQSVLPASWNLRRTVDAQGLDLPNARPGLSATAQNGAGGLSIR